MKERILITNTNSIEGGIIENYAGLVSINIVIGTNFFSDFGASLADVFGGQSETYQRKLQRIYDIALSGIRDKAEGLGANAIIGLSIDFDEISGKGKSMFMISAFGTAINVKYEEVPSAQTNENHLTISLDSLQQEMTRALIVQEVKEGNLPDEKQWEYLLNNPTASIITYLIDAYLKSADKNEYDTFPKEVLLLKYIFRYIKGLDVSIATSNLYEKLDVNPKLILEIIKNCNLLSIDKTRTLFNEGKIGLGVLSLAADKTFYVKEDLSIMYEIIELIDHLPDTGEIKLIKPTLGKAKEKFKCANGHVNDLEDEYCQESNCYINIKGLTHKDVKVVNSFRLKTECLYRLLES